VYNLLDQKFLLILPTYMEAENIPLLAEKLRKSLYGYNYEVVVVDDNSPDDTCEIAEKLGFNVVVRPKKMGLASAFLEGAQHAEAELIGVMDADLQHPPEALPLMLNEVYSGSDLVVASRYANGGKIEGWPLHRRLISRVAIALAHLLLSNTRAVKDPVSGFFIVKREVIEGAQLNPQGFKILLDILTKGKYGKVVEVPYTFKPREHGRSKFDFREIWSYIKHLYKLAHHILVTDHEKAIARNVQSLPPLTEKAK